MLISSFATDRLRRAGRVGLDTKVNCRLLHFQECVSIVSSWTCLFDAHKCVIHPLILWCLMRKQDLLGDQGECILMTRSAKDTEEAHLFGVRYIEIHRAYLTFA